MKLRLALLLAALPLMAHADGGDAQSIYQVSDTIPMALTSTSARTAALPNQTRAVRFFSTTIAHCKFGNSSVVATSSSTPIGAQTPETFKIRPTDGNYIACIRDSADGTIWFDLMKP